MADTLTETRFVKENLPETRGAPPFVRGLREEGLALFDSLPMPSHATEEWRYTDVSALDLGAFQPFAPGRVAANLDDVDEGVLAALGELGERAGLAIQHNSETATAHLDPAAAAEGVLFMGLDAALAAHPDLLERRLHGLVPPDRSRFIALHAAFRTGGLLVYVPNDVRVALPLQSLVYLDADGAAIFPHTLIVAERGSEVTLIERSVSPPGVGGLSVAVTEIFAGPGSHVRSVSLQDYGEGVRHLAVHRAHLERDSELRSFSVAFGGSLSRVEVESVLAEPGAHSEMLGVYFADGEQHYDFRSIQDHLAPSCSSDLLYKGALKGRSRAVYSGWVRIRKEAQRSNAFQTNRNVVLSEHAKADSIPNLEIEANDVRCGHAASVGPVDENVRFYLQSRGIPAEEAERLIVTGFFQEVLDRVALAEVRDGVAAAVEEELRRG